MRLWTNLVVVERHVWVSVVDLDHTADVQLHAWGSTLVEAFENVATAMYGYMTELDTVEIDLSQIRHVRVECVWFD